MDSDNNTLDVERIAVGIDAACDMIYPRPHKATFRRHLVDTGLVTPRKIGVRSVYLVSEIEDAISKLPVGSIKAADAASEAADIVPDASCRIKVRDAPATSPTQSPKSGTDQYSAEARNGQ